MKNRNFVKIGFKLLGIYSAFQFIATLPTAFTVTQSRSYFENSTGEIEEAWLGYFSKLVLSTNLSCLFFLILQLAGIYALITWLPNFEQTLLRTVIYGSWQNPQVPTLQRFHENWSVITAPALGTILGLFLLFRVNGMIRVVRLARPMNKDPK